MNNENIKEICDAITPEIMKLVQNIFADLKNELVLQIKDEVSNKALNEVQIVIDSKVKAYGERITELESKIAMLNKEQVYADNQPIQKSKATAVDGINTLSAAQMDEILSFPKLYIENDGWIYYYKLHHNNYGSVDYGEIFKVRTDGTQNQKIFNGKAHYLFTDYFKLKGNLLYFHDNDNQKRAIRV